MPFFKKINVAYSERINLLSSSSFQLNGQTVTKMIHLAQNAQKIMPINKERTFMYKPNSLLFKKYK